MNAMETTITKFDQCRVLVVGDLMIDEYLWGQVDRISPEAPVQVVSVQKENFTLGGAGNVVNNLAALGAHVLAVGTIGTGQDGNRMLEAFNKAGVNTKGVIREPHRPTTRKTRIIAANQHVLRIDRETKKEISPESRLAISQYIEAAISQVDVVLISDYGKGLITRQLLIGIVAAANRHKKVTIADPKGFDFSKYSGVSMITPNRKEAGLAAGIEINNRADLISAGNKLRKSVGLQRLLVTCGKEGMVLFQEGKDPFSIRSQARQVFDVSGAGDTVISLLGLAVASGASFEQAATLANTAAGLVVGKVGTATISRNELSRAIAPVADDTAFKFTELSELPDQIDELKKAGKKIVLTNGCFDFLHAGHITFFSASKKQGDILIVAIDDDESVKAIKGPSRPVISARERVRTLGALDMIDLVVIFSSTELNRLIEIIKPDVLTKGSNYTANQVLGREVVERHGGRVELIPVTGKRSSTSIINTIRRDGKPGE
jgi:D-beta-D-heptose 7-phosphate kinase / D-beta-D-heptose 1-phosphate adenosyltransferase